MTINKKGFTLVEILSVIVILSVVVLIATNAVLPSMTSANKDVLATEANIMLPHAQTLYAKQGLSTTKCYSYQEVLAAGTLTKNDDNYTGSFLIEVDANGNKSYKVWLSNGKYMIDGKSPDYTSDDVIASGEDASTTCGVVVE